jgi:probable phosphoglycerate mutase
LYLSRHGQSDYNAQGRLQGQLESQLTSLGKQQAAQLAKTAQNWEIKHVISSPLCRARETAGICASALNLKAEVQSGFEERHYGQWQGSFLKQLHTFEHFKRHCYSKPNLLPCAGAESTTHVRSRMIEKLKLLNHTQEHNTGNILLISHGDAIDCLMSMWTTPLNMTNAQHVRLVRTTSSYVWDKR